MLCRTLLKENNLIYLKYVPIQIIKYDIEELFIVQDDLLETNAFIFTTAEGKKGKEQPHVGSVK